MLVLGRKIGESIKIGDDVTVTVISVDGDKVRVGIDAPKAVPVNRIEVWEQVREANQASVTAARPVRARRSS